MACSVVLSWFTSLCEACHILHHTRRDGKPKVVARWVVDPETAPKITAAFTLFAGGASYAEIDAATRLYNSNGSYVSMLRNRSYLGVLKFGAEEFPNMIPPLVDQETWDQVQARIAKGAQYIPRPGSEYLLSGLARCDYCGGALSGGVDRRGERRGFKAWRYYKCDRKRRQGNAVCPDQRHVGADQLEKRVVQAVLERILTFDNVTRIAAELQERLGGARLAEEIADLDGQIAGVKRGLTNLIATAERLGPAAGAVADTITARWAELADLEGQREEKERRQQALARAIAPDELAAVLASLRAGVSSEEVSVARRALKAFVEQVVVRGDEFRIDYREEVLLALGEVPPRGFELIPCTRWRGQWRVVIR